jgi:hypothetical protein
MLHNQKELETIGEIVAKIDVIEIKPVSKAPRVQGLQKNGDQIWGQGSLSY